MNPANDTPWLAIEVGCATCRIDTKIIGIYPTLEEATDAADQVYDDRTGPICNQYATEVHLIPDPKPKEGSP